MLAIVICCLVFASAFVIILVSNDVAIVRCGMFERKVYQEMIRWKNEYALAYALFLKGARRAGKTTLAEKLGSAERPVP